MGYQACPSCGGQKHPLNACQNCGFIRNQEVIHKLEQIKNSISKKTLKPANNRSKGNNNSLITCPICNTKVKELNLKRHFSRVHNDRKSLAVEMKMAYSEQQLCSDKQISDFLKNNPVKDYSGRFGTPQDKYRWGAYGRSSMEYDTWRKDS